MSKKIDFMHSLIFFNFCIILSAITFIQNQNFLIFCLLLIMSLGISHGSLDNLKGKKLLKIYKIKQIENNKIISRFFMFIYLKLFLFNVISWVYCPYTRINQWINTSDSIVVNFLQESGRGREAGRIVVNNEIHDTSPL